MAEFMTEFEQERRPSPPPTPALPTISAEEASMISFDEPENFSDTARLTMNASAMSGFGSVNLSTSPSPSPSVPLPTSPKLYQPASIDPEIDRKKVHKLLTYDRKAFIRDTLNTVRSVAGRVVNLHQKRIDPNASSETDQNRQQQLQERRQEKIQRQTTREDDQDSDSSSVVDESIPMTSTASDYSIKTDQASTVSHTTPTNSSIMIPSSPDTSRLYGYSFNVFSPQNSLRVFLYKMFCWKWMETFIMLLIALHGITLFVVGWGSNPFPVPPSSWGQVWYQYVLFVVFIIYTILAICRMIVHGIFFNPPSAHLPRAYFRHSWDRIDFVSIVSYWVDFGLLVTNQEFVEDEGRHGGKVILNSLKKAAPLLVNVLFFVFFFFVIFAIIGVQSFSGSFQRHCVWHDPNNSSNTEELQQYCGGYVNETGHTVPYKLKNGENALWYKGFICEQGLVCEETENPFGGTISFDNIFSSMLIVMIIAGVQSWTDRMYDMMDAEYVFASFYFIVIVIVMNFWLINLFIAVITEMFAKVREDSKHSAFTSSTAKPVLADVNEEGWEFSEITEPQDSKKKRSPLLWIVTVTKPFWVFLVVLDLICMAAKNNDMSQSQLDALGFVETIFSIAFLVEIFLRMLAHRKDLNEFFKDKKNSTDLLIAVITCIIQIPQIKHNSWIYIWFTGFQVLRIYRVVMAVPRLRNLMSRVLGSMYGLINLTFFIMLSTLLCSIIAYQLFEGVINETGEEMRFFSIYNTFAALYQLFSGEDWTTVLYNVLDAGSTNSNSAIYALFLVFWFCFSNFVLVNMFIAVLMENFEIAEEDRRKNQVLSFMKKTETELNKKTVVSRWNIYRYFKPKPKGLDITSIPSNLVLSVQKNIVKEFMNEVQPEAEHRPRQPEQYGEAKHEKQQHGMVSKAMYFFSQFFPPPPTEQPIASTSNLTRHSLHLDPSNPFEQVGTFYDLKNHRADEPRALRYLVDPTLRDTAASRYQQETTDQEIEERKALKRDFIAAHPTYDRSLYLFSNRNPIRRWCQLIVQPSRGERTFGAPASRWKSLIFSVLITCCVIANVVLTIQNSPVYQYKHRNDPDAVMKLFYADWAFTIIFTFEFLIKVIADGFMMTPNAYLLNGWNALDLFVLVTLYMSNFERFAGATGIERGFRAFKALRVLRLINLLGPAKDTFTSILFTGLPRILDAAALGLCLIVPFALYGQNVFMGLFYQCNDDDSTGKADCRFENTLSTQEPMPENTAIYIPRQWANPYDYNFDSFWRSLLILFEIASGEGWVDVMETSMGITGKDQSPEQDASQLYGIFFMIYNLAGSVFVISLFLGVVIENFTRRNGSAYLTSDQRRWVDLKKFLNQIRPAKRPKNPPTDGLRKLCYNWTVEKRGQFYKFMTVIVTLNIVFLCVDTISDSDPGSYDVTTWDQAKVYVYLGFIIIYCLEIVIKLLGLGWSSFRKNLWNLFDLVMVIGGLLTTIVHFVNPGLQSNVELQKLFMTALCLKLVQRSDSLNQLFTTMAASAYQILNIFAVWFIVLTTYAIMFMQIFGLTKYGPSATNEHINFRTFSSTLISLIRYSTGEGWNTIMHDFTIEYPNCVVADNYLDSDCGSLRWAYFLFLSFNIISMYIFTSIFVAVVADNFSYVYQTQANFSLINRDEIRKFKMTWASVDQERTGYVKPNDYMVFWRKLDGVFTVRIFEPEYSYKNLVNHSKSRDKTKIDKYDHTLDLVALNSKLNELNLQEVHKKRHDLEKIYWESALIESGSKGVSFNQMLLMLSQRKLIVAEHSLILEELLENQKKEEAINTLISIDRVRGLMETIALRKKFLKHLKNQKQQNLPEIMVDNQIVQPSTPSISYTPNQLNNTYHDLTSEEESGDEEIRIIEETTMVEDSLSHSIWQEMLQNESKPIYNMGSLDKKKNKKPVEKKNKKAIDKSNKKTQDSSNKFEQAILELGGTKGDVKYLENVSDEQDIVTNEGGKEEDSLKNELKSFMKNIGLSSEVYEKDVETDEEEEDNVNESEEEEEEQESEEQESEEQESEEEESEEEEEEENEPMKIHTPKSSKGLLVEPTPFWYNVSLPPVSVENVQRLSPVETSEKYGYAKQLLQEENTKAETHPMLTSSNRSFMSNIITSGTLNDKVSALTLMFRESPIHGIKTLDTLMSMGRKKGRNEAVMAVTSLKDLLIGSVLPDRKLIYFADRPLASKQVTDLHLLVWIFEDHLKKTFLEFIRLIEELSRDTLMHVRNNMVTCINDLLSNKPEQEQNLLKLLINKLGDSDNKVAAKTSQLTVELLVQHPGMKMVVIRELEQLLFLPSTSEKAQYYAMITLNQTILTGKDTAVANKLVEIYFIFFRKLLNIVERDEKEELKKKKANKDEEEEEKEDENKKKSNKKIQKEKQEKKKAIELEDHQTKMIAAILTGVNRAFHFANVSDKIVEENMETLFKMTHASTFNAAIQALSLIFTISQNRTNMSDRFYRTLYESLLDPRIHQSSKQNMYLNLLYKAIRADTDMRRVMAYVKRMIQIASRHQPAFVCGIFFLLSQLMQAKPGLKVMLNTPEEDDEEEHFVDEPEEGENKPVKKVLEYDGRKRDPRFSNAEKSCLWELIPFKTHYHPSVVKYAESLFAGELITNQPDLHQFSLMHFLDRFVYRNPKKTTTTKGQSIMQPLPNSRRDGGILFTKTANRNEAPVNSDQFIKMKEDDVAADEVFFHKYFTQKAATQPKKTKKEATGDDEDEDEVWRAMMSSIPGGLDDEDEDDIDEELYNDEDDEEMQALLAEDEDDEEIEGLEEDEEEDIEFGSDEEDIELLNASDMEEESTKRTFPEEDEYESEEEKPKSKKAKKERLPTFATYEDYAKLIEQDE
ncbi:hypothetical protein G6F47_004900 [Rhizopus delemar]|nr:hypothetical protein G6F54_003066 [Rhizopus delemar]KAG1528030.1 hypothetical protein G6F52_001009 [Rhizopus delemar]KAG1573053.1 hypothetical protein G6F50_003192 [Rhizopus delemar]KAG1600114.1 hypothetical protein G6F47_004900 [Rhizopus delemar]